MILRTQTDQRNCKDPEKPKCLELKLKLSQKQLMMFAIEVNLVEHLHDQKATKMHCGAFVVGRQSQLSWPVTLRIKTNNTEA